MLQPMVYLEPVQMLHVDGRDEFFNLSHIFNRFNLGNCNFTKSKFYQN